MTEEGDEEEGDEVERKSEIMEKAYVQTAEEVLGYKKKKNKPWLSQKAWTLIGQAALIASEIGISRKEMKSTVLFGKMFARIDGNLIPFVFEGANRGKCVVKNAKKGYGLD